MTSVIVPVYNAQPYLEETISSILRQTERDLELILVDDGSTDDSLKICREAAEKDSRVTVISTPNRGVSAARNTGLDICKGDTITFVDADDVLNPLFLEFMDTLCYPNSISVCGQSHKPVETPLNHDFNLKVTTLTGIAAAEQSLYQKRILNSPCGKVYSRKLFFNPPLRFRTGIRFEDLDIATPLLCRAREVNIIPAKLYFYRKTPGSFMNSDSDARMDCLKVTDDTLRWVAQNHYSFLVDAALSRKVSAAFHIFRWINKRRPDLKTVADNCFETIKKNRRKLLLNPDVRLKNKAALLASFTGQKFLSFLCRIS